MWIRFDTYLIDEATATGDQRFSQKSHEVFRARMAESSAIMVSPNMNDIRFFAMPVLFCTTEK